MTNKLMEIVNNYRFPDVTEEILGKVGIPKLQKIIKDAYEDKHMFIEQLINIYHDGLYEIKSIPPCSFPKEKIKERLEIINKYFKKLVKQEETTEWYEYVLYDITRIIEEDILKYHKSFTSELIYPLPMEGKFKFLWIKPAYWYGFYE